MAAGREACPPPPLLAPGPEPPLAGRGAPYRAVANGGTGYEVLSDPGAGWHLEAGRGLPGAGELDGRASGAGQGDLPQLALGSSWARNPRQLRNPSGGAEGAAAELGHPWGMGQTITFLIEYLINYSGAKSIIHISFKRGGKSHCPLTAASQRLPRPWGLSHPQERLSQQECGCGHRRPPRARTATGHPRTWSRCHPRGASQVEQYKQRVETATCLLRHPSDTVERERSIWLLRKKPVPQSFRAGPKKEMTFGLRFDRGQGREGREGHPRPVQRCRGAKSVQGWGQWVTQVIEERVHR